MKCSQVSFIVVIYIGLKQSNGSKNLEHFLLSKTEQETSHRLYT